MLVSVDRNEEKVKKTKKVGFFAEKRSFEHMDSGMLYLHRINKVFFFSYTFTLRKLYAIEVFANLGIGDGFTLGDVT